ncbi:MAG: prepilin-type N-terminal cleavage/methylation domain-containing protein [Planctomycetota bacterium]|nr:prepilin-type N-terminal cleavage/methylation domain-containing protein [Planctomycetota bacterium]
MVKKAVDSEVGVTLIELLVVLSILSVLMGLSISVFSSFGEAQTLEIASSGISTTVRAARNWSISTGMPSRILVDPDRGKVSAFGFQLAGAWGFEDFHGLPEKVPLPVGSKTMGAFRQPAELVGRVEACAGSVGRGAMFLNDGAAFRARRLPIYDGRDGVSIEAWVNFWQPPWLPEDGIEPDGGFSDPRREMRMAVLGIPNSFEMGVLGDGAVYMEIGDPQRASEGEFIRAQTEGSAVISDRWVHLRATFDRTELVIEIDGVEQFWVPERFEKVVIDQWPPLPTAVPHSDSDLWISHPNRFFMGAIDQVVLRVATAPVVVEMPIDIEILGPTTLIHLDGRGALDPLQHNRPVVIHVAEVGDFSEIEAADGTAVAGEGFRDRIERERQEQTSRDEEIAQAFGDPISDLMKHLEDWEVDPDALTEGVEEQNPVPSTPGMHYGIGDVDGTSVLRLHNIVIDMTGAIRG